MADCYVIASVEGDKLLVQRIHSCDDGFFMARVLVSIISSHFNKLPEVALHVAPPVRVHQDQILHAFAVISLSEFAHGPLPERKVPAHLMFHAGVQRVASIQDENFPVFSGAIGSNSFHIPCCNELLLFINDVNCAVRKAFGKRGSILSAKGIMCSVTVWSHVMGRLDGACAVASKKGTKSTPFHIMNRPNCVRLSCDSVVLKVYCLDALNQLLGECYAYAVLNITQLLYLSFIMGLCHVEGYHFSRFYKPPGGRSLDGPSTTFPLYGLMCSEDRPIVMEFKPTAQEVCIIATKELIEYIPLYEQCPPAPSFHAPRISSTHRRTVMKRLVLPCYELFEWSSDLQVLLASVVGANGEFVYTAHHCLILMLYYLCVIIAYYIIYLCYAGNLDLIRSVLEWNRLRPGEGPPSRHLLQECARYLKVAIPAGGSMHIIVMSVVTAIDAAMKA
jgi:hypothetical protein